MTGPALKRVLRIVESGPLARIDSRDLPDLDVLALEVLASARVADVLTERWEDAHDYEEDIPTRFPDTDLWRGGEAQVGWFRTNPCVCGDEHRFDLDDVPMDDDGRPVGTAARGAFLGVWYR